MDKVINLREVHIKKFEEEAYEKLGAIKIVEDLYMITINKICSKNIT